MNLITDFSIFLEKMASDCTFCIDQSDIKQWHRVQDGCYCEALYIDYINTC